MIMTVQVFQQPGQLALPNGWHGYQPPMQGIRFLLHGHQKAGKTSLGDSGPRPVLLLDAEQAGLWTPSRKITWDPSRETCPVPDGSWDTCVVRVSDYQGPMSLLQLLQSGRHPFNSVTMDSTSSVQQRAIMSMAGMRKMERDQWGQLLRIINAMITGYGDLVTNPVRKVWAVTFITGTAFDHASRKWRPMLQGQSRDFVPYVPEMTGWVYAAGDNTRHLWIGPSNDYETGNRLWGRLPDDMQLGYPGVVPGWTIETMVSQALGLGQ